jgi:hypothetical protein
MNVNRMVSALIGLLLFVYAADWISFARRSGSALGSVTYYYASANKGGRAEVYFDQPQTEVCAKSIFPHSGYSPCWYSSRKSNIRTIN